MTDTGTPPTREELVALQDELSDARAEVERLQAEAASAAAEAAELRGELEGARSAAEREALARQEFAGAAEARLRSAAERYRDLVVKTEPELPPEMIAGDDIDAIDASAAVARDVVGRIRQRLDGERQAARVPAGAPQRGAPDLSALSPEQKIRLGLERRAS